MKMYKLYVDELGTSHPGNYITQPYYILMGCIMESNSQDELKIKADQIKFKYWGKTNIVFHSADMARDQKDFAIFAGKPALKSEFQKDLLSYLHMAKVQFTVCIIDKAAINAKGWNEAKIVEYTARSVMKAFLAKVKANAPSNGKMIFEISNSFKDRTYLETFNYLTSPNFARTDTDYNFRDVRETLTSINFVTKQNHDIETQISDFLSYAAKCKALASTGTVTYTTTSYEGKLIKILESKLITTPPNAGVTKGLFLNKINSFEIVS